MEIANPEAVARAAPVASDPISIVDGIIGLRLTLAASPPEIEEIVSFFEDIATAEGWQPGGELRAHVDHSTYFGLWTQAKQGESSERVVAALQLLIPSGGTLPTQQVWPELILIDPDRTAHVTVLAVGDGWRGKAGGLFWLLTASMWNHCVREGIRELWLEATPRTMRCYERLGWPLRAVGPVREHWAEPCVPCVLSVRDVAGALAERAVKSPAYRRILARMVGDAEP